jgi:hypothetical protein
MSGKIDCFPNKLGPGSGEAGARRNNVVPHVIRNVGLPALVIAVLVAFHASVDIDGGLEYGLQSNILIILEHKTHDCPPKSKYTRDLAVIRIRQRSQPLTLFRYREPT